MTSASADEKGYNYASGYGPISSMPFLHPLTLARKKEFWKINPMKPGLLIESSRNKWPDFLMCGSSSPNEFLSEKVLDSWNAENISFTHVTEMPIGRIKSKKVQATPPRYFVVQVPPGIEVDFPASNIPTDAEGNPILKPLPKPWPPILKLDAASWTGLDLFTWSNYRQSMGYDYLCTQRLVDLAERDGWTNVKFTPIEAV